MKLFLLEVNIILHISITSYLQADAHIQKKNTRDIALIIPGNINRVFADDSAHTNIYFDSWNLLMAKHTELVLNAFGLTQDKRTYTAEELDSNYSGSIYEVIKRTVLNDNNINKASEILNNYIFEIKEGSNSNLIDVLDYAPLYAVDAVYLRAEAAYSYLMSSFGLINDYQRQQAEVFLYNTFYSYPFSTGRLEVNFKPFSATDGDEPEDVMREFLRK